MKHIKQMKPLNCKKDIIDFISTEDGYAKLRPDLLEQFKDLQCSLIYVHRLNDNLNKLKKSPIDLNYNQTKLKLEHDYFEANCRIQSKGTISKKFYASVKRDENLVEKSKLKTSKNEFNLNVLFYGFDSLSRVHFQRKLPKAYDFLIKKLNITVLQSYNIVGDGSPQGTDLIFVSSF